MPPDLAGFVVSGDESAWDDEVAAVLGQLEQAFALLPDPNGAAHGVPHRRCTWFDTFDWRLYRAGLLLEYVAARRGGELLLASIGDPRQGLARQPVTGWRLTAPHPATDIPDGPLAARVSSVTSPRVLLPVATVAGAVSVTRLLNADGKTVARLVLESPAVVSADHPRLPPRLAITEIRGYPGQARRAARIVAQAPGIQPASGTVLADALAAVGRRPGDYSNKVDAPVSEAMPAAGAVAVILLRLLDTLEANVGGVIRDIDTEFLHDLRVSVRRTRAALKLLGDALVAAEALTADELDRFAADFKWLGDLTTPTRDLDVHLLEFGDMAAGLAAARPEDLEPFRSFLKRRRVRASRALARGLRSPRFGALSAEWRKTLLAARDAESIGPRGGGPGRSGTTRELAADRTLRAFRRVARRGGAITPASPHESLHDLRKRCKELRYVLEFFAPLHDPATYGKVIGDLKRLQDCLGQFQDSEVQIAEIRALAEAMLAADAAPAVTLLAMGEVTSGIAARQAAARADFERRFAAFAGTDGQRRMAALLHGGPHEDLRDVQHQRRRREDDHRGQPRPPGGRRRAADGAVGPGPAGGGELHVPGEAAGQGRWQGARPRQATARRRDQGHRLRQPGPDSRRLHVPDHGPAAERVRSRQACPPALQPARPARRRIRRDVPRLPAEHLAAFGKRAARRRRDPDTAHSDHAVGADSGSAHGIRRRIELPPPGRARVPLHGRPP